MTFIEVDPTTVTNPPRGTDPAELRQAADLIAAGKFASDGVSYADKAEAVKVASKVVRGIKWLRIDGVNPTARYNQAPDGTFSFYIKNREVADDED